MRQKLIQDNHNTTQGKFYLKPHGIGGLTPGLPQNPKYRRFLRLNKISTIVKSECYLEENSRNFVKNSTFFCENSTKSSKRLKVPEVFAPACPGKSFNKTACILKPTKKSFPLAQIYLSTGTRLVFVYL